MKNLRVAKVQTLIPSMTVLTLLLGTALMTRAIRPDKPMDSLRAAVEDESSIAQSVRVAELLEQDKFAEAEFLLLAMPTTPIPMNATPGTDAFQVQAQALKRLGTALIQAALRQGGEGKKDEAMTRIRFCRTLLHHRGNSPQALKISQELKSQADSAEHRLTNQLI